MDDVTPLLAPGGYVALLSVLFGLAIRTLWRSDVASRKQAEGWKAIVDELRAELARRDEQYQEDLARKDEIIAELRSRA